MVLRVKVPRFKFFCPAINVWMWRLESLRTIYLNLTVSVDIHFEPNGLISILQGCDIVLRARHRQGYVVDDDRVAKAGKTHAVGLVLRLV